MLECEEGCECVELESVKEGLGVDRGDRLVGVQLRARTVSMMANPVRRYRDQVRTTPLALMSIRKLFLPNSFSTSCAAFLIVSSCLASTSYTFSLAP